MSSRNYRSSEKTGCGPVIGCFALFLAIMFAISFVLMLAWNAVMPSIFGLPHIDYLQAFALYLVVAIIFGTIRGSSSSKG